MMRFDLRNDDRLQIGDTIVLHFVQKSGVRATFQLHQDGRVSRHWLTPGQRIALPEIQSSAELEHKTGRAARLILDVPRPIAVRRVRSIDPIDPPN